MKQFIFITFIIFFCFNAVNAQTNANISGPENVLVVYRPPIDQNDSIGIVSQAIKNYYVNERGIPNSNVVPLNDLISHDINIDGVIHPVIIAENGNIIRDSLGHEWQTWFVTQHAWKYYYQYVAEPIKQHLINNNLTSTIRYIVLCKGVPFKLQAGGDHGSVICNQSIDGLLCMLNTNNYDILLDSIYNKYRRFAVPAPNYYSSNCMIITNPYYSYNSSANLIMNNRFKGGVFTRYWNGHTIKLDYLVSHLEGINYNMVKGMIDKSTEAIHSNNYDWFIDADPTPCHGGRIMVDFADSTALMFNSIGFSNYSFNVDEDTITYHNKPIMSYSSNGVHTTKPPLTGEGQTLHPDYIQSQLNFNYAQGCIFNTAESFNAHLLGSITRRPGAEMGQVVEFFLKGGTLGVGHAYEPYTGGIIRDGVMLPAYQVGYTFIDAAYMGMQYLAWQNVFVGDPLTTIAWGKQSLTTDLSWSGTNLVTGVIDISDGLTLAIANNSTLNLKHQGFISGEGKMVIGQNVTFNIYSWDKGLFLSYDGPSPRLVWGAHPSLGLNATYKVYRKIGTNNWTLIETTSYLEYTDEEMFFYIPQGDEADNVFYKVTAQNELPGTYESNTVSTIANKEKLEKKIFAENEKMEYSLDQNYPNPFNPTTEIKYSIKENGLVTLKVYDILGKVIANLVNENKEAGNYSVSFDASQIPSGVYIYSMQSGSFISSKKMILIK